MMRLCFQSAVLLMVIYCVCASVCPDVRDTKKKFRVYEKKVNWYAALLNCSAEGMSLATIESQEEQDELVAHLKTLCAEEYTCFDRWWIGGADLHENGEFIWFSTGKPIVYQHYLEGEPSNHYNGGHEHCLELRGHRGWNHKWNDIDCLFEQYFVCEYFVQT